MMFKIAFISFLVSFLYFVSVIAEECDVYYVAEFSDDIVSCPDFENKVFNAEGLKVGMVPGNDDEEGGLLLSGPLDIYQDLVDGAAKYLSNGLSDIHSDHSFQIELKVAKLLDLGKEYMYGCTADICSNLKDKNTPWYPLVESMNISSCPIEAKEYMIDGMTVALDFADEVLCHEFCGEYEIELYIMKELEELSCYIISVSIMEKQDCN